MASHVTQTVILMAVITIYTCHCEDRLLEGVSDNTQSAFLSETTDIVSFLDVSTAPLSTAASRATSKKTTLQNRISQGFILIPNSTQSHFTAETTDVVITILDDSTTPLSTTRNHDTSKKTTFQNQVLKETISYTTRNDSLDHTTNAITLREVSDDPMGKASSSTSIKSETTTLQDRLSESTLISRNARNQSFVQATGTTTFRENIFSTGSTEDTSEKITSQEGVTLNPVITQNNSVSLSKDTVTLEDVAETEKSTTVRESSESTTLQDSYLLLCESEMKTVSCPNDFIIEVKSASYGYNGNNTEARGKCDPKAWWWNRGSDSTRCHEQTSSDILTDKCGGRSECEVLASNDVFGDPCKGTTKYLEVFYICRSEPRSNQVTTIPNEVQNSSSTASTMQRPTVTFSEASKAQMNTVSTGDGPRTTTSHETPTEQVTLIVNITQNMALSSTTGNVSGHATDTQRRTDITSSMDNTSGRSETNTLQDTVVSGNAAVTQKSMDITGSTDITGSRSETKTLQETPTKQVPLTVIITQNRAFSSTTGNGVSGNATDTQRRADVTRSTDNTSGRSETKNLQDIYLLLCENQIETVSCPNNSIIEIVSVSYGYNKSNTEAREQCDDFWNRHSPSRDTDNTECHHPNSTNILINECNGRSECEVSASNTVFEDPCSGITKYLEVFYSCTSETTTEQETLTVNIAQNISLGSTTGTVVSGNAAGTQKSIDITGSTDITGGRSETKTLQGTITLNDITEAQLSATTPRDGSKAKALQRSSFNWLLLMKVLACLTLLVIVVVVVVVVVLLRRRTRHGIQLQQIFERNETNGYSMKTLDSTYKAFESNGKEQTTNIA